MRSHSRGLLDRDSTVPIHPAASTPTTTIDAASRRREIAIDLCCLLLVLAPFLRLWTPRLQGPIDLRYDAGVYYTLGTSLAEGHGYRLLNEPGQIPDNQYPPLLPAIIALHQLALGTSDPAIVGPWLRLSFFLLSAAFIVASYYLAKRYLSRTFAVSVGLICALHVDTVFFSDLCFAEIPFGLATVGFFLLQDRWGRWGRLAQGSLGLAAFLLRTIGITLLAAWVVEALLKKQWKSAAIRFAVALLPFLLWQAYVAHVSAGPSYAQPAYVYQRAAYMNYNVSYAENMSLIDPFIPELGRHSLRTRIRQTAWNTLDMVPTLGEMVSSRRMYWWWTLDEVGAAFGKADLHNYYAWPAVPLGILVLIGIGAFALKRQWLVLFYLLGTLGMICLTPWPKQFTRYLVPVIPLLAIALFQGLMPLLRLRRVPAYAGITVIALLVAIVLSSQVLALRKMHQMMRGTVSYATPDGARRPYTLFYCDEAWSGFEQALTWLKSNANADEIVVTTAPQWTWLWTGLLTAQPPYETDRAEEIRQLETVGATYIILDAFDYPGGDVGRRYAEPAVRAHPEIWELAFTASERGVQIFRHRDPTQ